MKLTGEVFWRWWAAGTVSSAGSAVGAVALPLTALTVLDATPFEMGLIAAAGYAAWLVLGLPAGVIVQRVPLRGVQVAADLARAGAVASIPLAWWQGWLTVAQLAIVALVVSFASVLFDVANTTFLPAIEPAERLQSRNSLMSGTQAVTDLGGPALGGVAVQVLGAVPTMARNSRCSRSTWFATCTPRPAGWACCWPPRASARWPAPRSRLGSPGPSAPRAGCWWPAPRSWSARS